MNARDGVSSAVALLASPFSLRMMAITRLRLAPWAIARQVARL